MVADTIVGGGDEATHTELDEEQDDPGHRKQVRQRWNVERVHRRPDECAEDGTEAERSVEPRHDRALEQLFDGSGFDVHRHVPLAGTEAEHEQSGANDDRTHLGTDGDQRSPAIDTTDMIATVRRAPRRWTTTPEAGSDNSDPTAVISRTTPSSPGSSSSASRICGTRDSSEAIATPGNVKTTKTLRSARRAGAAGVAVGPVTLGGYVSASQTRRSPIRDDELPLTRSG